MYELSVEADPVLIPQSNRQAISQRIQGRQAGTARAKHRCHTHTHLPLLTVQAIIENSAKAIPLGSWNPGVRGSVGPRAGFSPTKTRICRRMARRTAAAGFSFSPCRRLTWPGVVALFAVHCALSLFRTKRVNGRRK